MSEIGDLAWEIISKTTGCERSRRDTSCLYFATAAAAALRGEGWRFAAGGAFLPSSEMMGWGVSISPADQTYCCSADREVDPEDGQYVGHCWVERGSACISIVDIMEGYYGPRTSTNPWVVYHRVPSLGRSIRAFYRPRLAAVAKAARANQKFVEAVKAAALKAEQN